MSGQTAAVLCIILYYFGLVNTDTEADGYSGEVKALFEKLTDYKHNIDKAKAKMNEFAGKTWDKKYAIAIINLYTRESLFYRTLNFQMRNNYPDNTTNIWQDAGDLINRGLDILGQTVHELLFRGCRNLNTRPAAGEDFLFNQITSTSASRSTAEGFVTCTNGILFHISNVYGVSVEKYSSFSTEKEVVLKSCNIFKVDKGPIKEHGYNVYYLDGQTDVNGINKECKWDEPFDRENTGDENDACRTGLGILQTGAVVMMMMLILS